MSATAEAGAAAAAALAAPGGDGLAALDERDAEPRTPMKRLGSTRKLAAFANIRAALAEQSRVLEARAEASAGVANELSDYCRRRADVEHEYARALDKLARAALQRQRDHKAKREHWSLVGAQGAWRAAVEHTRGLARDHAALGELLGGPLSARLARAADDALRLHRKCRDVVAERHDELAAALAEAGQAAKAHAAAHADWRAQALKLRAAHDARLAALADTRSAKKIKSLDKELEKRLQRHSVARARALRARADYALSLDAANATLQRYYLDDVADIMLCMEVGFEAVVGKCVRAMGGAEAGAASAAVTSAQAIAASAQAMDAAGERQRVVAQHAQAFAPPRPLQLRAAHADDQDAEMRALLGDAAPERDAAADAVDEELRLRLTQLEAAARQLRAECRESAKTLDAAEAELVRQMEGPDLDVAKLFGAAANAESAPVPPAGQDDDGPRKDQEDYYLAKFRSYVSCAGRLTRLESKAAAVRARLLGAGGGGGGGGGVSGGAEPVSPVLRAGHSRGLFAAPLTGPGPGPGSAPALPRVLTACVRVIAGYGLRHQGLFRVSGSQVDTQALRAAFERGEDPLARVRDANDVNSVCGLLKLYLRSLRPPLLPPAAAERLLAETATHPVDVDDAALRRMRDVIASLPLPNMIVLRYLTAFLSHLTEYSAYNMMDAWNLAVCVGPTLVPAAAAQIVGGGGVAAHNLGNELVKRLIVHHKQLFAQDVAPHTLYRPPSEGDEPDATDGANGTDGDCCRDDILDESRDEREGRDGRDGRDAGRHDGRDLRDDLSLFADDDEESSSEGEVFEGAEGAEGRMGSGADDRCGHRASATAVAAAGPDEDASAVRAARGQAAEREETSDSAAVLAAPPPSPAPAPACAPAHTAAAPRVAPPPPVRRLVEATPDLVLDLPARAASSAAATPEPPDAEAEAAAEADGASAEAGEAAVETEADVPRADPADAFAHNRDTLKKRPASHRRSEGGSESTEASTGETTPPVGAGSPVPPRNTLRVAAKFAAADLTLTGGSLAPLTPLTPLAKPQPKPQLAAKPALLRRPTPHPHHGPPVRPEPPTVPQHQPEPAVQEP